MSRPKKGWRQPDEVREKIQASLLINRLQDHVGGKLLPDGTREEVPMSPTQVQACKILLNKVIPDLKAVEVSTDPNNPLEIVTKVDWCIVEPSK